MIRTRFLPLARRLSLVPCALPSPRAAPSAALAIVVLLLGAALGGCGHPADDAGGQLRRGLSGEPASLDPAGAGDNFSSQVIQDLYEGLTAESPGGEVVPGVASSWRVDARGLRYTFHLRQEALWSNGEPVRARDFVTAWQRVVDPREHSPGADNLRLVAGATAIIARRAPPGTLGVEAVRDDTLVVTLAEPAAYFPQILADASAFPVYSAAAARTHDAASWVSNGPYVLSRWQPGAQLELVRNGRYWDQAHVTIPRVTYQFSSDAGAQYARYRSGQLDLTDEVPANELPALRAAHSTELVVAPFLATAYYGFNFGAGPLRSQRVLRQALAMAIDRRQLVQVLGFGEAGAYGLVPPGTWHYTPQPWAWSTLDDAARIAAARRLYAQAGYSPARPLHLRVLFNSNLGIKRTAVLIAAMWKETLGVDTALVEEEYRVFLQSRRDPTRWDVARLGWTADFNDASNFLDILRSHSANNDMGYANAGYDGLLDRAAAAVDVDERRTLLQSAERLGLDDYPIIPLYHFVSKQLVKPYVRGVHPSPLNSVPSKSLSLLPH